MLQGRIPHIRVVGGVKTVNGWTDMGQTLSRYLQIPWGLTDRDTGTVYYLTAAEGPPARLALNTSHALGGAVAPRVYPAFDEPFAPTPNGTMFRIFVRAGRLGFEPFDTHIHSGHRLIATSVTNWQTVRYELLFPAGFTVDDNPVFETDPDDGRRF